MNLIRKFVKKNLHLNKKRAVVTVIGIILSVALLSALTSMVSSFQKSLVAFEKDKEGDYHAGFTHVTEADLLDFDNNRALEGYFTIKEMGYGVIYESKNEYKPYCRLIGTDLYGMQMAHFKLLEGRFPENENEIVIPRHLDTNGRVKYKIGDVLTLQIGQRVTVKDHTPLYYNVPYSKDDETLIDTEEKSFTVVGVIERPAFGFENFECPAYSFITCTEERSGDLSVYVRLNRANLKNFPRVVAGIMGINPDIAEKAANNELMTEEEEAEFSKQMTESKFGYINNSWLLRYERVWPVGRTFSVVFSLAAVVAFIIVFTSVYCIKNSFEISITEKIKQYGMLSSIGATKKQIRKSVHYEATVLGCFGIPIGLLSGLFAGFILIKVSNYLLKESLSIELIFHPSILALVLAVILGIITIYFSATGSARKAGKISPMEAIRNQNEISITAKSVKAPKYVGKLFGIGGLVSYKNIKRNRRKYRTTVVSIVICTVTFIVISYFMSMGRDLLGFAYQEDDYNLNLYISLEDNVEFDPSIFIDIKGYKEMEVAQARTLFLENATYTKEYDTYLEKSGAMSEYKIVCMLDLDDASFEKYAKEVGIANPDGKCILVNNNLVNWYEENGRVVNGDIPVYEYKAGDAISGCTRDTSEIKFDENGEVIEESVIKTPYEFLIDKITDKRPMGFVASDMTCYLVMSDSTVKSNNIELENNYNFYYMSDDPDKLEDDIEEIIGNIQDENAGYSLYNRDSNMREEKSVFLLLDIFAYGLIVVIALIGITNIINTLNTSMELRSREFATLRSVGMTDKQYNKMVLLETVFTAGKSVVLGVVIGLLITIGIHWVETNYDMVIPYRLPLVSIIIAIAVVFGLIYAIIRTSMNRIMKRNIIETIKNENL